MQQTWGARRVAGLMGPMAGDSRAQPPRTVQGTYPFLLALPNHSDRLHSCGPPLINFPLPHSQIV